MAPTPDSPDLPPTREPRPLLGLTVGDPAGIGPELVARVVQDDAVRAAARLVVLGPEAWLPELPRTTEGELESDAASCELSGLVTSEPAEVPSGVDSLAGGAAALGALRVGARLAAAGTLEGLVTAPVSKRALMLAGERVEGQTELLARWAGVERYEMLGIVGKLRVLLLSRHVPTAEALRLVTEERVVDHLALLDEALRGLGIPDPHLALAGVNPHAGEAGLIGSEELDLLNPAVERARAAGLRVTGPLPPDSVYVRAWRGAFDGVLALYHDQAFIPLKLLGAVTQDQPLTTIAGLPYLRVSPAHGTAFDIAGRGVADPSNLRAAVLAAAEWALARRRVPARPSSR